MRKKGAFWQQQGTSEHIIEEGLRAGMFLNIAELEMVMTSVGCAFPNSGRGKQGRVLKIDKVEKLVDFLFPLSLIHI